jgi:hypothetical protein
MTFIQKYIAVLQRVSSKKASLHLIGLISVAIGVGSYFANELGQYAGLLLLGGVLFMLPVLGVVLQERGDKRRKTRKGKRRR